jgi:hypothetical protein
VETILVVVHYIVDQIEQSYHQIVEMLVVEEEHIRVVGEVMEYKLVVEEVEPRILVVEELVVEQEQAQDMGVDMVEEQDKVEELEQVQTLVVVGELLVIVDMAASMVHQLLAMNGAYQLVALKHRCFDR